MSRRDWTGGGDTSASLNPGVDALSVRVVVSGGSAGADRRAPVGGQERIDHHTGQLPGEVGAQVRDDAVVSSTVRGIVTEPRARDIGKIASPERLVKTPGLPAACGRCGCGRKSLPEWRASLQDRRVCT